MNQAIGLATSEVVKVNKVVPLKNIVAQRDKLNKLKSNISTMNQLISYDSNQESIEFQLAQLEEEIKTEQMNKIILPSDPMFGGQISEGQNDEFAGLYN
jgi:protein subunit release factor A